MLYKYDREADEAAKAVLKPRIMQIILFEWRNASKRPPRSGWVYVMRGPDVSKIGSTVDPDMRRMAIATSAPFPVQLVHLIKSDDMARLEKMLHACFEASWKWVYNEWFRLSDFDIEIIKSAGSVINRDQIEAAFDHIWHSLPELDELSDL